jgi:nucleolysin TIA-1/TIAR
MTDESQPKTLYVGNLDQSVTEELLCALFTQMGSVKGCKIIREQGNDPYAFIEFTSHQAASTALTAMNKRSFLDKEMKVNWATSPGNQPKTDTSQHHHIFVGDLSPEIETETLREAFAPFGDISNCRIVRDPQTLKSKGYAFVSFLKKADAENAIQSMNGQWLGSRSIRTNWSTRKPPPPREILKGGMGKGKSSFEEIYNQTSPTNTTVYCGGFPANIMSEELMHKHFGQFGSIQSVRVFKDKGYAFIKFTSKDAATHAIENTHDTDIHGCLVKCFWGKENGGEIDNTQQSANTNQIPPQGAQYPYSYQQMGYWYQPGYPAQMPAQYMQQGYYPYAYTSPQQGSTGAATYRMMQPANMAYMGMQAAAVPSVSNGASTQPPVMYTAMPQYQTQ